MKNTDFMNLSLPEGADKIDVEILNSDFAAIENLLEQHAIIETMTLNGEGVIIGAIGPYIRLQNIDTVQVSIDIGNETYTLASGENIVIRETAENIGIITSGNVHITYFVNPKTYADKEFYTKEKVDELLSNVEATVEVDAELSETSENPVQNKVITAELASYATTVEVESKVTEKVAEIVAGAPEDFDTLKEMSDWLKQHENSAATMNSAIQKNAEDIETANENIEKIIDNSLKYGYVGIYVDAVNGSDDNDGSSASKFKTIEKAIEQSKLYQKCQIYLADGEYTVSSHWYMYNQQVHISGASIENTIIKINKTILTDNTYLDFYRCTLDTTASTSNNPIRLTYNTILRVVETNIITVAQTCIRLEYESCIYAKQTIFTGATANPVSAVYNSEIEIVNCTSNNSGKMKIHDGGKLYIWGNEFGYNVDENRGEVYKDGIQVYPVDISGTTAAMNTAIQQNKTDIATGNTNIQKNVDDITAVKNDITINRATLGVQQKNLLKSTKASTTTHGVTFTKNVDGSITVNGTSTANNNDYYLWGSYGSTKPLLQQKGTYIISMGAEFANSGISAYLITNGTYTRREFNSETIAWTVTDDVASTHLTCIMIRVKSGVTVNNVTIYPMVRHSFIDDGTYEPYIPSLQEQINTLLARIETLEGTATTEGGE